jgi:hypothetical protein
MKNSRRARTRRNRALADRNDLARELGFYPSEPIEEVPAVPATKGGRAGRRARTP